MCGIFAVIGKGVKIGDYKDCMKRLHARGPEGTKYLPIDGKGFLGFTRLAINGLTDQGMQPMEREGSTWVVNGEIYNWRTLDATNSLNCTSGSDCEVIGALYTDLYADESLTSIGGLFSSLDGVFATILVDTSKNRVIVARDPYGVRPLFVGTSQERLFFGSELKSLDTVCDTVEAFPPGTVTVYDLVSREVLFTEKYHKISTVALPIFSDVDVAATAVRVALETAVKKRMMMERPVAVLLSGGLDSSLVASLVASELKADGRPPLKTFSIGMAGSSDLKHARLVADWIGSDHTEVVTTPEEMFEAIPPVIFHIESYDTTTVRASVGNWLVSKAVAEKSDCKVVFNGDGSDEVWGSYLYFYGAPSAREYEAEVLRLLDEIHTFDVLRSDRSISSNGLEPRTPFLDKAFVQTVLSVPLKYRMPRRENRVNGVKTQCEKWLLRHAFDDGKTLPKEVLWRRKEAFSDGVSGTEKSWFQNIQEMVVDRVPKNWQKMATKNFPDNAPLTAEMFYYRSCFEAIYGLSFSTVTVPKFWMPRWTTATDPSARTLAIYDVVEDSVLADSVTVGATVTAPLTTVS